MSPMYIIHCPTKAMVIDALKEENNETNPEWATINVFGIMYIDIYGISWFRILKGERFIRMRAPREKGKDLNREPWLIFIDNRILETVFGKLWDTGISQKIDWVGIKIRFLARVTY
ncbi:hypothetical protein G9A89_002440 [Geosiphon pyriformis]|nr:hypothetical protein G9A89_002440 [Geosiphon pyriformis]